jgi:dephospho-CoA kinase
MNFLKETIILTIQLPLGVIVAAATERFCRGGISPYAKWRNIAVKSAITYLLASFTVKGDNNTERAARELMCLMLHILLLLCGVVFGTSLQPVGLTGGIATGKSTVSSLLSHSSHDDTNAKEEDEVDFIIIDVDGIAHDILLPEKLGQDSVYKRLVAEFGTGILEDYKDSNKTNPLIDRRKLGDIVFKDRQKRRKLNSITHPKIIKIMLQRILLEGLNINSSSSKRRRVVCADIPLLFEGGLPMRMLFGTIIVVTCKPELQLDRLQKRNTDLTLEQCRERIASQIPVEEKAKKAHKVIRNDGDMKALKQDVLRVKGEVGRAVAGKDRGVELWCLVLIFVGIRLLW